MTQTFGGAMQAFSPQLPLGVALSGGADSTALLLACVKRWPQQVVALHINHGLQAAASQFEAHCRAMCLQLNVPLRVGAVHAAHAPGQSPEDAARHARYAGLLALAGGCAPDAGPQAGASLDMLPDNAPQEMPLKSIALAQHADDQVETVLLALSRGAGMAGLAAMPGRWERGGVHFHRPLLQVAGSDIRQWLQDQGQNWVEDPSNTDERYTRNRIRARLLPALQEVFPHIRDTVARSASHAAQAHALLEELASQDFIACAGAEPAGVLLAEVQKLSAARRANLLRYWLKLRYNAVPSTAQLEALLVQVEAARTRGHRIRLKVAGGIVLRQGPVLAWYNQQDLLR